MQETINECFAKLVRLYKGQDSYGLSQRLEVDGVNYSIDFEFKVVPKVCKTCHQDIPSAKDKYP